MKKQYKTFFEIAQEIENGKRFRNIGWTTFRELDNCTFVTTSSLSEPIWELEPDTIAVTKEDLARAWDKYIWEYGRSKECTSSEGGPAFRSFCKELGLEMK